MSILALSGTYTAPDTQNFLLSRSAPLVVSGLNEGGIQLAFLGINTISLPTSPKISRRKGPILQLRSPLLGGNTQSFHLGIKTLVEPPQGHTSLTGDRFPLNVSPLSQANIEALASPRIANRMLSSNQYPERTNANIALSHGLKFAPSTALRRNVPNSPLVTLGAEKFSSRSPIPGSFSGREMHRRTLSPMIGYSGRPGSGEIRNPVNGHRNFRASVPSSPMVKIGSPNLAIPSSNKTKVVKRSVAPKAWNTHQIFLLCYHLETDVEWKDIFSDASVGKLPRGFVYMRSNLTFYKKKKSESVKLSVDQDSLLEMIKAAEDAAHLSSLMMISSTPNIGYSSPKFTSSYLTTPTLHAIRSPTPLSLGAPTVFPTPNKNSENGSDRYEGSSDWSDSEDSDDLLEEAIGLYSDIKDFMREHSDISTSEEMKALKLQYQDEPLLTWSKITRHSVRKNMIDQYVRRYAVIEDLSDGQQEQLLRLIRFGFSQQILASKSIEFNGEFITNIKGFTKNATSGQFELTGKKNRRKVPSSYSQEEMINPNSKLTGSTKQPSYNKLWEKYLTQTREMIRPRRATVRFSGSDEAKIEDPIKN